MQSPLSSFLDFNLPNATTWFYFSFLLAVAMFFKFSRLLSVRNLDVVMMFLLAPGLLVVQASRPPRLKVEQQPAVQIASMVAHGAQPNSQLALETQMAHYTQQCGRTAENLGWQWFGYLWIMLGSVYFFCRCLLDLTIVQRPALPPNLQIGGLGWLAGALLICLLAVAYRQVERHINPLPINGTANVAPILEPADQTGFAVEILWRHWPVWAVAALAFACHITVVLLLAFIAWRHFQDLAAGMAAVTFYLLLPYTGLYVGHLHHALPMALFLGTILAFRSPTLTGALLGLATAVTYFPLFVLPTWLSFYRERGSGRFLTAFLLTVILCLAGVGMTLWLNSDLDDSLQTALDSPAWQPWKDPAAHRAPATEGFWTGVPWAYRIPIFLVFLSFVVATMFWPTPKNLAHVIALCAAIFIALQWWCAEQGGVYLLWYVPLLLLLVFRPNLQDRVPLPIVAETDWLTRSLRWCVRKLRREVKLPEPAEKNAV